MGPRKRVARASALHLDRLIAEATVDCYNESEEITGIFTMLEENLAVPFMTKLLGVEVTVERVDLNDADEIVAVCRRGREHQRIPVLDLLLPKPIPRGAEWVDAYRRWARGR
jgi:predicted regulator of amino acid metabolism with ACT domain